MSHVLRLVNDKGGRIHAISKKAIAKSIQLSPGDRFQLGRISELLRTIKFEMYPFLANNQKIKNETGKKTQWRGPRISDVPTFREKSEIRWKLWSFKGVKCHAFKGCDGIREPENFGQKSGDIMWYPIIGIWIRGCRNHRNSPSPDSDHDWWWLSGWKGPGIPTKRLTNGWCYGETIRDHGLNDIPKAEDVYHSSLSFLSSSNRIKEGPTESTGYTVPPKPQKLQKLRLRPFTSAAVQVQPHIPRIRWGSSRNPWWFHPHPSVMISSMNLLLGIHRFRNKFNKQKRWNEHL